MQPAKRRLGIERLLMACDEHSVSSARVILKCGGVLEREVPTDDELIRRYGIRLRKRARSL